MSETNVAADHGVERTGGSGSNAGFGVAVPRRLTFKRLRVTKTTSEKRCCDECGHTGTDGGSKSESYCGGCGETVPYPKEDLCPSCGMTNCMLIACPECGGKYSLNDDEDDIETQNDQGQRTERAPAK